LDGIFGGEHEDRDGAARSQAVADFKAIHAREHPIQDDEVGGVVTGQDQPGAPVGGGVDSVALVGKAALEQLEDRLVVFDDEYALVHGSHSR
jgi:hypothetical protein